MLCITIFMAAIENRVRIAELRHFVDDLAAAPTRRNRLGIGGNCAITKRPAMHRNRDQARPQPAMIGIQNRRRFRAKRQAIAGIFKIAAGDNRAIIKQQSRTNMKI